MMYVLTGLVVVLALACGVLYAMLKLREAEHRAEIARLTLKNKDLERKIVDMRRANNVKEGMK